MLTLIKVVEVILISNKAEFRTGKLSVKKMDNI